MFLPQTPPSRADMQNGHTTTSKPRLVPELSFAQSRQGYTEPTPSSAAIPSSFRDATCSAPPDRTGKTAGFTLPLLQRSPHATKLLARAAPGALPDPHATREWRPCTTSCADYASTFRCAPFCVYAASHNPQIGGARRVEILVATRGACSASSDRRP